MSTKKSQKILNVPLFPLLIISFVFTLFLGFSWFVSDIIRAAKVDRYILYYIDDVFRYCFIRDALQNTLIFLHPYPKPLYTIVATIFSRLIPLGMVSLRVMNSFFSAGVLFVLYRLMKKLDFEEPFSILAILITATVPLYFILSISTLTEIMFCFLLISALYFFYSERYLLSVILTSLLPTTRQEGLIYLGIWSLFLLWRHKSRYIPLLFIPSLIWGSLNYLILRHSFMDTFWYVIRIMEQPPVRSLISAPVRFLFTLGYPTLILFLIGLATKLFDRRYLPLLVCFSLPFAFQVVFHIILCQADNDFPGFQLRFMVPLVPIMAIYVTSSIRIVARRFIRKEKLIRLFLVTVILGLVTSHIFQVGELQKDSRVIRETFSPGQEHTLMEVSNWLNDYARRENIKNLYAPWDETTHKSLRRLWMNLSPNINYYATYEHKDRLFAFDVAVLNTDLAHKIEGMGVTVSKEKFTEYKLVKKFPSISLYFYLLKGLQ